MDHNTIHAINIVVNVPNNEDIIEDNVHLFIPLLSIRPVIQNITLDIINAINKPLPVTFKLIDVINIDIFIINSIREDMKKTVELLETTVNTTYDLVLAMANLKNAAEIKNKVVEVNKLEEQADRLYENAIKELYKNEANAIEIIKAFKGE